MAKKTAEVIVQGRETVARRRGHQTVVGCQCAEAQKTEADGGDTAYADRRCYVISAYLNRGILQAVKSGSSKALNPGTYFRGRFAILSASPGQ